MNVMLLYKIDLFLRYLHLRIMQSFASYFPTIHRLLDLLLVEVIPALSVAAHLDPPQPLLLCFRVLCAHKNKYMVSWINIQALLKHSVYFNNPLNFHKCLFVASPPLKYILELLLLIAYHSKSEMKQAFVNHL